MNERYAVDPQAPSDWRELKLLLDRVGLQSGRPSSTVRSPRPEFSSMKSTLEISNTEIFVMARL